MTELKTEEWPLIPRKRLLGNPSRINPKLSPDGRRLAWQAPVDGVMNIWVAPADEISLAQPLTRLRGRPPGGTTGAPTGASFCLSTTRTATKVTISMLSIPRRRSSQFDAVAESECAAVPAFADLPGSVWIGLNDRDARWHDVWSLDLATGERKLVYENTKCFGGFLPDWQGVVRLAFRSEPANGGEQSLSASGRALGAVALRSVRGFAGIVRRYT